MSLPSSPYRKSGEGEVTQERSSGRMVTLASFANIQDSDVLGPISKMVKRSDGVNDSTDHPWSLRVRGLPGDEQKVYSGRHVFSVGRQASFTDEDSHPSAVEYLLGALGGDLVSGFLKQAAKRGVQIDATELVVSGRLENPMVFLGVIGAEGGAGLGAVAATLYVGADADEPTLQEIWRATLATSPLVGTLGRSVPLTLSLQRTL